jgi:hypothetical protein
LAVTSFIFGIIQYAVDIPQADDYDNILGSMNQLYQSQNIAEVGSILFAQHNEHRLVFNRIVSITLLKIFGRIDFFWLIAIGNLAIFIIVWIIFRTYRCDEEKFLYFSPAIFFIFQPQYDSFVWAMAALSNFYVIAFAVLCIYFLLKKIPGAFIYALLAAIAATFTQSNGVLILFVGLIVLVFQKKFYQAAAWFSITMAILFFYFFHYTSPAHHPKITFGLFHPLTTLRYFLSFLGNFSHPSLSLAFGVIILLFFGFLTVKKYFAVNPAIYSLLLFFFISAVAVALGRSGFGVEQALASRYKIFSILLVILSYLALMEIIANQKMKRWLLTFFIIFSLLFNFLAYVNMREPLESRRNELIDGIIQWQKNGTGLAYPNLIHADVILRESIKNGIYSIPKQWVNENK